MKCEYNKIQIDWINALEWYNNKWKYDIMVSIKELVKQCLDCNFKLKCDNKYDYVRHLDKKAL